MLSRAKNIEQIFLDSSFIPEKHLKVHEASLKEARRIDKECIAEQLRNENYDIFLVNMRASSNFKDVEKDPFAKHSSLVCLTQTCLEDNEGGFQWPGRRCMAPASSGEGKGVCCITDGKQNTLFRTKLVREKFQLIKVTMRDKFQIFIVYVSPNSNHQVYQDISDAIEELLMPGLEPIIIGDFNFDAKIKNPLSAYLQNEIGMTQLVKEPTFALGPNTIDHIYVRPYLEKQIKISYRFNYYTDHCSFNLSMK